MGTNRPDAAHYDKLMELHVTEVLIKPKPMSLSPAELKAENDPVVEDQKPTHLPVAEVAHHIGEGSRAGGHPVS